MKNKKILAALLSLLLLTSCVTKAIWGSKSYEERINQFLVGEDGRYVVLISSRFHYVLTDGTGILKTILSLKQRDVLTIDSKKSDLELSSNNDMSGDLVISGPFSILPPEDRDILRNLGIGPDRYDVVSIRIKLNGRRYQAKYLEGLPLLNTSYIIPIHYRDSNLVKDMGKAAITPVAVGLDAVLLIGKIIIYPFTL